MGMYGRAKEAADEAMSKLDKVAPSSEHKYRQSIITLRGNIAKERQDAVVRRLAKEEDEDRRQTLIQAARLAATKAKTNYIHLLPRDVLINIAEHGLAVKMATVCRDWRASVTSQAGLWERLTVGGKRPVAKAKLWMERSRGRIIELKVESSFDASRFGKELTDMLEKSVGGMRRFIVDTERLTPLMLHLKERFLELERLELRQLDSREFWPAEIRADRPDLGLLHPNARNLKHLRLKDICFVKTDDKSPRLSAPEFGDQFTRVESAHFTGCRISNRTPKHVELLASFPAIRKFSLSQMDPPWGEQYPTEDEPTVTVDSLVSYAEDEYIDVGIRFAHVNAPSLLSLDFWGSRYRHPGTGILDQILAPGLAAARPNLISLDIGKCPFDQNRLLGVLADLPKLKFLNVSCCGIDNAFLAGLERKNDGRLPELQALSIAGNDQITAGAVRDLVYSRLPPDARPTTRPVVPMKRTSSFLPTAPRTKTVKQPPASLTPVSQSSSQPSLPSIQWLVLDSCERIDPDAAPLLRKKVRFVSHWLGTPVEARIRGKGRWAWDGDWQESCGNGDDNVCQLRKVQGVSSVFPA